MEEVIFFGYGCGFWDLKRIFGRKKINDSTLEG